MNKYECRCIVCGKTFLAGRIGVECCSQECRNIRPPRAQWDDDRTPCEAGSCHKQNRADCNQGCDLWRAWFYRRWRNIRRSAGVE